MALERALSLHSEFWECLSALFSDFTDCNLLASSSRYIMRVHLTRRVRELIFLGLYAILECFCIPSRYRDLLLHRLNTAIGHLDGSELERSNECKVRGKGSWSFAICALCRHLVVLSVGVSLLWGCAALQVNRVRGW